MAVDATPLELSQLPAVLAGPILRRLTRTSVTVWMALSRSDGVTLTVGLASGSTQSTTVTGDPTQSARTSGCWL